MPDSDLKYVTQVMSLWGTLFKCIKVISKITFELRNLRHPQFRLRIGEIRVFYDVIETDVVIIAIMSKEKTIEWLEEHGTK